MLRSGAFEHVAIDATGQGIETLSDDAAIDRYLVLGVEGLWVADASVFPEVRGRTRTCRRSRRPSGSRT
jgi:hypothetical protein